MRLKETVPITPGKTKDSFTVEEVSLSSAESRISYAFHVSPADVIPLPERSGLRSKHGKRKTEQSMELTRTEHVENQQLAEIAKQIKFMKKLHPKVPLR